MIAELINSILSGKLSPEVAKERGEKYLSPDNGKLVCTSLVNEEIWDSLPRRSKSVDIAFQRVQETLTQGISSLPLLADKLAKDVQNKQTSNMTDIMHHVMDYLVLVTHANWSLNMKRQELIKPDLNPLFTRLCKPEIAPTTKLLGDDLQKHVKEMTDVSRVGKQLQKNPLELRPHSQSGGPHKNSGNLRVPTKDKLQCQTLAFTAGLVKNHISHWELITQDPFTLRAIQHYNIKFAETLLLQTTPPMNKTFSPAEKEIIQNEIIKLSLKGVIEEGITPMIAIYQMCLSHPRRMAATE